jgi:hypothetical protein
MVALASQGTTIMSFPGQPILRLFSPTAWARKPSPAQSDNSLRLPRPSRPSILSSISGLFSSLKMSSKPEKNKVLYLDAIGRSQVSLVATDLIGNEVALMQGWHTLKSNVTYVRPLIVRGDVHLILSDDFILTAKQGIKVNAGHSLTIYGQTNGTGTIDAVGGNVGHAGIGGSYAHSGGVITINGGTINAKGGDLSAGIGAGMDNGIPTNVSGGAITINGGAVTAMGGSLGAGIGGGYFGSGGIIRITGGAVKAMSGSLGAGIGGGMRGDGGTILITGGTVNAASSGAGAGIGGGADGAGGDITITGASTVTAFGGAGNVASSGGGAGIGSGGASSTSPMPVGRIVIDSSGTVSAYCGVGENGFGAGTEVGTGGCQGASGIVTMYLIPAQSRLASNVAATDTDKPSPSPSAVQGNEDLGSTMEKIRGLDAIIGAETIKNDLDDETDNETKSEHDAESVADHILTTKILSEDSSSPAFMRRGSKNSGSLRNLAANSIRSYPLSGRVHLPTPPMPRKKITITV